MQITLDHIEQHSETIASFYFKPERRLDYTAGQFIELTVPHAKPDDRGTKRWFTLSSSPTQDLLSITTHFSPEHGSSYKQALQKLAAGEQLQMSEAMGDFVLPRLVQTPVVFVAGGIGVTPYLSMLRWLKDTEENRHIRMLAAVRSESDMVFQDVFSDAQQSVTYLVSQPSAAWGGERGRLSAELILGLEEPDPDTLIYISGPELMVENLTKDLRKAGIEKHQIVGDYFPNYPEALL